ncbi:CGNR zinc finger domain-containing protein [Microbacterium sp. A93]|uniref:CGNR zinc finger domain-containing protein n=1 Tax=Microbacterium sp. A93 TaxID=3450716 RepID=UPI003F42D461
MFSATTTARLAQAATLANTAPGFRGGRQLPDRLDGPAGLPSPLPSILPDWGFEDDPSSATLRSIRKLRAVVAGVWQDAAAQDVDAALEGINTLLGAAGTVRAVLPTDSTVRSPAVLVAGQEGDAPDKALSTAFALALTDMAVAGELSRLRTCSGEDCSNAFVDLTRNRSKQFCDEANCANRAHVKAYRARRAAEAAPAPEEAAGQPAPENLKTGKKTGKAGKKKAKKK